MLINLSPQMSSTLPTSAQPKAIDMWFFYCIFRFFLFFVFHCIVDFHYKKTIEVANPYKITFASFKQDKPLIPRQVSGYNSLKEPPTRLNKDEKNVPRRRGRWMIEDKSSILSIICPSGPLSPELTNKISLLFGVCQDILFVVTFCLYLKATNSSIMAQFDTFKDCSRKG